MSQLTSVQWTTEQPLETATSIKADEPVTGAGIEAVTANASELESLRGVTSAAADLSECVCPEPCERDHANE